MPGLPSTVDATCYRGNLSIQVKMVQLVHPDMPDQCKHAGKSDLIMFNHWWLDGDAGDQRAFDRDTTNEGHALKKCKAVNDKFEGEMTAVQAALRESKQELYAARLDANGERVTAKALAAKLSVYQEDLQEADAKINAAEVALSIAIAAKMKLQHDAARLQQQLEYNMTIVVASGDNIATECSLLLNKLGAEVSFALALICCVALAIASRFVCGSLAKLGAETGRSYSKH